MFPVFLWPSSASALSVQGGTNRKWSCLRGERGGHAGSVKGAEVSLQVLGFVIVREEVIFIYVILIVVLVPLGDILFVVLVVVLLYLLGALLTSIVVIVRFSRV